MSVTNITYLSSLYHHKFFVFADYLSTFFYFCDRIEITKFLKSLENNKVYVVTFELFLSDFKDNNHPCIKLSEPILVTNLSCPTILGEFILDQIKIADIELGLDYELLTNMKVNKTSAPYIYVKYNHINIF